MHKTKPAVSILLVAYNSAAYLENCIASIIAHSRDVAIELLLIDNGADGCGAQAAARFPEVRLIPSRGNIGFGAGNNVLAREATADLLLLINPDTRLVDPAVERLLAFAGTCPQAAAWGGQTRTPAGELDGGNWIQPPSLGQLAGSAFAVPVSPGQRRRVAAQTGPYRAPVLCGGFMMMRRDVFETLGGFDESFFLYSEEVDLFTRFAACGHQAWVTPDAVIVHDVGSGDLFGPARTLWKTRGQMHYVRKHWSAPAAMLAGVLIWLGAGQRAARGTLLGRWKRSWAGMAPAYGPIFRHPGRWWSGYAKRP